MGVPLATSGQVLCVLLIESWVGWGELPLLRVLKMTIRAKLILNALLPVVLGILVAGMLYQADRTGRQAERHADRAHEVVHNAFMLTFLSYDYLMQSNERAKLQWYSKYNVLMSQLGQFEQVAGVDRASFERLRTHLRVMEQLFMRVQRLDDQDTEVARRYRERSIGQLMIKSAALETEASVYSTQAQMVAQQVRAQSMWYSSFALLLFVLILAKISWMIGRSILVPLAELRKGIGKIGKGNLNHKVRIVQWDEMGRVVQAFNEMAGKLQGSYAMLSDEIKVRQQAEEDLRILNQTLEDRVRIRTQDLAERNRELDAFTYVASHDLRAPLRGIDHLAKWISEDAEEALPDESKRHLKLMQTRVGRMERLLDDLLHYSRAGRYLYECEMVDSKALVADVIEYLVPPSGMHFDVADDMPIFETAKVPLTQVFQNLIGNAIKYHNNPQGQIQIGVSKEAEWYRFWVSDDGPGIAPEFHEKIFKMFQKLQSIDEVEGTGIGLAVVKKTVESYGGIITLQSDVGKGAHFEFTWPMHIERTMP